MKIGKLSFTTLRGKIRHKKNYGEVNVWCKLFGHISADDVGIDIEDLKKDFSTEEIYHRCLRCGVRLYLF